MYNYGTSAVEMLKPVFEVLEGGAEVASENVVEFIADNGAKIADITTKEVLASNGAAAEVAEVVDISAGASAGTATGAGFLAMDVGLAGAAIAPVLGVAAGIGLYNLAPEFWTNVSNKLMDAGKTVKGKVLALIDKNGKTSFDLETLEIFKNALIEANIYNNENPEISTAIGKQYNIENITNANDIITTSFSVNANYFINNNLTEYDFETAFICCSMSSNGYGIKNGIEDCTNIPLLFSFPCREATDSLRGALGNMFMLLDAPSTLTRITISVLGTSPLRIKFIFNDLVKVVTAWGYNNPRGTGVSNLYNSNKWSDYVNEFILENGYRLHNAFTSNIIISPNLQPDATYPQIDVPLPQTYPNWVPSEFPEPLPETMPQYYPVEIPDNDTNQESAQEGQNNSDSQLDELVNLFYNLLPEPTPDISPDPDPSAQLDPETNPQPQPDPNPTDPNPDINPSPIAPLLPTLDSTNVNRMYTVYNPTDAQINALGGFLWTDSIIEQLKKLWSDPMDSIISFHKIYGIPSTSGSGNIILGYIDSGVSSLIVNNQFTEVDCGSVTVPERLHNATDYAPFTTLQIYLPFIGIVELDTNELMNATLHVRYRIDVYTGTCVALIGATREQDMPTEQILYTFSGNCSQSLPLTASNFRGAVSALLGLAGAGVSVATGGALGAVVGAMGAAHSLTSEMVHLQHSGGLSANAGILGYRKPYLILSRQYGYDASGYGGFYGYPANKTVYIGNCTGYIKCKDVIFRGSCTEAEANEIVTLLKNGVYV